MKHIQRPFTKSERFIKCPACSKYESRVDHLPQGTKTAWYCDLCGVRFRLEVLSDGRIECEVIEGQSKAKRLVTLRSEGPVTIQIATFTLLPIKDEIYSSRYYYEEHTCPTNYLRDVVKVISEDGDEDPHGIFKFVSIEPLK